ncbi:acyl-CoA dehydratase activase-related protein [Clostridium hydrogenum]|uniref:acyl-CoA dehydratase activase-related protein n=1 Tax=Clostridium hydrogenum TaxID=2855764 RepID=UPI001F2F88FA|nr:acyl-CoA dehydratase activase-related protein [Clostridium hydrogenum]
MKLGIPKGLLYENYNNFFNTFFSELGAEIIHSKETNKEILNLGVKYCVDEACLPIKVFHGHVACIKDKCDIMFIPRIMQLKKSEFICPKFCGLPEMIINDIPNMPQIISYPINAYDKRKFMHFIRNCGFLFTKNIYKIKTAYNHACLMQESSKVGIYDKNYNLNIALVGHPYNIYDKYLNLNIVKKLNSLGIGVITKDSLDECKITNEILSLFKKPFWTFARESYGFSSYCAKNKLVNGIIYISSFSCGIDSVLIELIKDNLNDFPMLILKIDEQTGEAGFDTRIEAFSDMLERRCLNYENNLSSIG